MTTVWWKERVDQLRRRDQKREQPVSQLHLPEDAPQDPEPESDESGVVEIDFTI